MATQQVQVEWVSEHDYLVSVPNGEDEVLIRLRSEAGTLSDLRLGELEEPRLVQAIMAYLLARQDVEDLPQELDLEDIVAAYDDFAESVRAAVAAGGAG
ncbi:hypothetical protein VSH64_16555 [Amycolatopsis rhabdoformis]|uniref:Phage tail assembly protein n=1 Tax=Amycolatopsis rhabdoformis TaxID=1448059 RepID=A0ABZ1IJ36_9PSEU|nr:hypothetical protein [Amycolatopsis rhabdoformis]WSE33698.1 hypothetical protein VSH64_16555 [Amycolatopsis rhabdoformis]